MAQPTSRDTLIEYCLRRLGAPVLEINVDPDQIDDKVDDALQTYRRFHSEGTYRTYISTELTDSDVDNRYIELPSDVMYVTRVFPMSVTGGSQSRNFFDVKYQIMLNDITSMHSYIGDLAYYEQVMQYLSLIDMKLSGSIQADYSRVQNRLYIYGEFANKDMEAGDYVVVEVFRAQDPQEATKIWSDSFIKDYTTALIKQQWGMNMMKFEGMQLPGGVQFSGRQYYEDATEELQMLRQRMRDEYELPPDFLVG
jgi:hypothetical protein